MDKDLGNSVPGAMTAKDQAMMEPTPHPDGGTSAERSAVAIQSLAKRLSARMQEQGLKLEDLQADDQTLKEIVEEDNIVHNSIVDYINHGAVGSTVEAANKYRDRILSANREKINGIHEKYGLDGKSGETVFLDEAIKALSEDGTE